MSKQNGQWAACGREGVVLLALRGMLRFCPNRIRYFRTQRGPVLELISPDGAQKATSSTKQGPSCPCKKTGAFDEERRDGGPGMLVTGVFLNLI